MKAGCCVLLHSMQLENWHHFRIMFLMKTVTNMSGLMWFYVILSSPAIQKFP